MKKIMLIVMCVAMVFLGGVGGTRRDEHIACVHQTYKAGETVEINLAFHDVNGLAYPGNFVAVELDANFMPVGMTYGLVTENCSEIIATGCDNDCPDDPNDTAINPLTDRCVKSRIAWHTTEFDAGHYEIPVVGRDKAGNETWIWVILDVVGEDTKPPTFGCR